MADPQDGLDALRAQLAALTARVYSLEQKLGIEPSPRPQFVPRSQPPAPALPEAPAEAPSVVTPPPPLRISTPMASPAPPVVAPARTDTDLEKKIGQFWLNRIGIVAILIGVSYFLKYAFDNNWIGPAGRIAIGLLAGTGLIVWSEWFRGHAYRAFSYSLKAVGIGTLYLSIWAAFQVYHMVPGAAAFAAMAIVTASTIALALSENAQLLASFALIGGFATPMLLSTGQNHEVVLFSYVCLLDLAVLSMAVYKPWRRLLWGSFAGTVILYLGWYAQFYSEDQRGVTVLFVALFGAVFAVIPLLVKQRHSTRFAGPSVTLTLLPLLNAAAVFLAFYSMYENQQDVLAGYALILAAAYLGISNWFRGRFPDHDATYINLLHVAIAVVFITIAIPLRLNAQWITIGWLVESAALLWVSVKMDAVVLRYLAAGALALGILRLLFFDQFRTETLLLNARFATYLVAIAVLGGIVTIGKAHVTQGEARFLRLAVVVLNLLALIALTLEASDYFSRQLTGALGMTGGVNFAQLGLEREFSYSAIWLVYGAALMAIGFVRRSSFVRWQALILIAVTSVKVFLYDVSALDKGYRILSFVALGGVLLAISFIYQRDWLKLSSRSSKEGVP
jgi:uncharacterized membrane protein